jgi:hypothetical protein
MKRGIALFALFCFLLAYVTPAVASQEDEQWQPLVGFKYNPPVDDAPKGFILQDSAARAFSFLYGERGTWGQDFERYICTSTRAEFCVDSDTFAYNAILPTCETATDLDCVVGLSTIDQAGVRHEGTFQQYASPNHPNDFAKDEFLAIPRGTSGGVWSIPGSPHGFGSLYAIYVTVAGAVKSQEGSSSTYGLNLSAHVVPVSIQKTLKRQQFWGCLQDNSLTPDIKNNTRCGSFYDQNEGFKCLGPYGSNNDECLAPRAFPKGTTFKLDVRFSKSPVGWLHGRLLDPAVLISQENGGYLLSVEAKPVKVPAVAHQAKYSELPNTVQDFWINMDSRCIARNACGTRSSNNYSLPLKSQSTIFTSLNFGEQALEGLRAYLPLVQDRASAIPSTWSWRTLGQWEFESVNKCLYEGEGVKGLVTTNASVYSAGPPAFVDGELRYRVAAPHEEPDRSTFKGDYSLLIDSQVARCLYNFSTAPISATISVVGEDGERSIATTTVSEKDGWLSLIARNFEFSSPVIIVKLSQEVKKEEASTSSPTVTTTPSSIDSPVARVIKKPIGEKSITICKKGKVEKKLSSKKLKCPKGWKKA